MAALPIDPRIQPADFARLGDGVRALSEAMRFELTS